MICTPNDQWKVTYKQQVIFENRNQWNISNELAGCYSFNKKLTELLEGGGGLQSTLDFWLPLLSGRPKRNPVRRAGAFAWRFAYTGRWPISKWNEWVSSSTLVVVVAAIVSTGAAAVWRRGAAAPPGGASVASVVHPSSAFRSYFLLIVFFSLKFCFTSLFIYFFGREDGGGAKLKERASQPKLWIGYWKFKDLLAMDETMNSHSTNH